MHVTSVSIPVNQFRVPVRPLSCSISLSSCICGTCWQTACSSEIWFNRRHSASKSISLPPVSTIHLLRTQTDIGNWAKHRIRLCLHVTIVEKLHVMKIGNLQLVWLHFLNIWRKVRSAREIALLTRNGFCLCLGPMFTLGKCLCHSPRLRFIRLHVACVPRRLSLLKARVPEFAAQS